MPEPNLHELPKFWWVFAVRGGSAIVFALALAFAGSLLGTIFFDPVVLVFLSLLLGVFVLGNGILLGIAAIFAFEQRLRIGFQLAAESLAAIAIGVYIGLSLRIDPQSLAWFAGIVALSAGAFQLMLGLRTHRLGHNPTLMALAGVLSLTAATLFLIHRTAATHTTAHWLSLFELLAGTIWLLFAYTLHHTPPLIPNP